jgi:hypothetical protein
VTLTVTNAGTIPHNFAIEGHGADRETPIIKPGETAMLTVDLHGNWSSIYPGGEA